MPSNDDMKHQSEEERKRGAFADAPLESVMLDDHGAGADETCTDEVSSAHRSSEHNITQEFTFFQKKKRVGQSVLVPSLAYASAAQVAAFAAQLDSAVAINSRTKRHIAELMVLMSEVACTLKPDESEPKSKRLSRAKCLFYGCLVGFGVGWFLLFPYGNNLITQLAAFLAK